MLLAVDAGSSSVFPVAAKAGRSHLRMLRGLPAPISLTGPILFGLGLHRRAT
jgi:hypothetical protein